jgi:hypothetical protein
MHRRRPAAWSRVSSATYNKPKDRISVHLEMNSHNSGNGHGVSGPTVTKITPCRWCDFAIARQHQFCPVFSIITLPLFFWGVFVVTCKTKNLLIEWSKAFAPYKKGPNMLVYSIKSFASLPIWSQSSWRHGTCAPNMAILFSYYVHCVCTTGDMDGVHHLPHDWIIDVIFFN